MDPAYVKSAEHIVQAPTTNARTSNVRPLRHHTLALLAAVDRPRAARAARPRREDSRAKQLLLLENDVARLRAEVARLMELKKLLQEQALNRPDNDAGSAVRRVTQYFEVFRRGYLPPTTRELAASFGCESKLDAFLFSVMDEDVLGGGFKGVAIMIEQWKRYGACFSGFRIDLQRAEVTFVEIDPRTGDPSRVHVTALAYYSSHLLLAGVEAMFPHVMANPSLVMRLIGQIIGGLGSYRFVYDCTRKHFVEMVIDIDMIRAFAKVVPSVHDLGLLFGSAQLTSQYYMGDDLPTNTEPLMAPNEPALTTVDANEPENGRVVEQMSIDRILCQGEK